MSAASHGPTANPSRCLGLIGGLGVGATIHYYTHLEKAHSTDPQGRTLNIVIAHAETPRVFSYVQANDRSGLAEYLAAFIRRLHAAGAEFAVIPAVTPHYCVRELAAISPVPLINIFDALTQELTARSARRVAVFGTRFVIESALYGELKGVEIVSPTPAEITFIHNTYVEVARVGKPSADGREHRDLTALAQDLIRREGLDAIIFAGTDLALVFNPTNTDFPYIDCAALHLKSILNHLLD
jgi:aspartate racemase